MARNAQGPMLSLPQIEGGPVRMTRAEWARIKREQDGPETEPAKGIPVRAHPSDSVESAEAYLRERRSYEVREDEPMAMLVPTHEVTAILSEASLQAELIKGLSRYEPLTAEERKKMMSHLRQARPLVARLLDPTYVRTIDLILEHYPKAKGRGRPRDERAIFSRHMLEWGSDPANISSPLTATELMAAAVAVGLERPRRRGVERLWITLHQRYSLAE